MPPSLRRSGRSAFGRRSVLAAGLCLMGFALGAAAQTPTPAAAGEPLPGFRPPLLLGIAIDDAGIGQRDLFRARDLVLSIIGHLPQGSLVTISSFSHEPRVILAPTADPEKVRRAFTDYAAGESRAAFTDGLFDAVDALASVPADLRALLLVSEGKAGEGDLRFEDPLNAAAAREIPIFALAFGQGDGKALRRVARLTRGEYVRLEVADGPMLVKAMFPRLEALPPSTPEPLHMAVSVPSPSAKNSRMPFGLLAGALVLLSVGGFLLIGVIALLSRRSRVATSAARGGEGAAASGAEPALKLRAEVRAASARAGDDEMLESTMVVNANPLLRALSGPAAGRNFPLMPRGTTTVGRSRSNDIVVPEDAASARHCRIDREGDSYVMYDLGSTNGTWVNGIRTERAILQHGDRLKVGETIYLVNLFGDRN